MIDIGEPWVVIGTKDSFSEHWNYLVQPNDLAYLRDLHAKGTAIMIQRLRADGATELLASIPSPSIARRIRAAHELLKSVPIRWISCKKR